MNTVIVADDVAGMAAVAAALEGNLTGCVYSDSTGKDDAAYAQLEPVLRGKVGRLLNDKMPTGVAVSPAMNHGGPYPGDRPSRLHGRRHPGVAAALRGAALLRRRPPAPAAARAREPEPHGQDVAADRRGVVAAGRRRVTRRRSPSPCRPRRNPGHGRAARGDADQRARAAGAAADHRRHVAARAQRQPVRHDPGRRDGLEPRRGRPRAVPDPQHAGRAARRGRHAGRARLPHRALGDRPAGARGRRDVARRRRRAVRRHVQRSVRRAHAGDGRACSTACRTATTRR